MGEIIPRPIPPAALRFTGERLTSDYGGQTQIEHMHRYLLAREWCRDKDVLDVASGEGYGTALLAQVAKSAVGVEIAADAVAHATNAYACKRLSYVQGDARALPAADAVFDIVVSFETIEHFAEQERFLDEVRRVLRPGGLLIVSTPDRDNYSPAETPANPYHVRELTGEEFEALLRSRFGEVSILRQRPAFGSVLLPSGATSGAGSPAPLCFERRGPQHFEASIGLARPQYFVAFASDAPATALPASVYIETGRLGMFSPAEYETKLQAAQSALDAERARAGAEMAVLAEAAWPEDARQAARDEWLAEGRRMAEAELQRVRDALRETEAQSSAARDRVAELAAALAAERDARHAESAEAQGEIKGLLLANEMTEHACTVLRDELNAARASRAEAEFAQIQEAELARIQEVEDRWQDHVRQLEAESAKLRDNTALAQTHLANTLASHSWRATAPLRGLSRMLYRRR